MDCHHVKLRKQTDIRSLAVNIFKAKRKQYFADHRDYMYMMTHANHFMLSTSLVCSESKEYHIHHAKHHKPFGYPEKYYRSVCKISSNYLTDSAPKAVFYSHIMTAPIVTAA